MAEGLVLEEEIGRLHIALEAALVERDRLRGVPHLWMLSPFPSGTMPHLPHLSPCVPTASRLG